MRATIQLTCDGCKTEFNRDKVEHNKRFKRGSSRVFCGLDCYNQFRKTDKNKTCPQCDRQFSSFDGRQVFCGHSCSAIHNNKSRKIDRLCPGCDSLMPRKQKYCSKKCRNDHKVRLWINGEVRLEFSDGCVSGIIRSYLLESVGYKCEECGWDRVNPITKSVPLEIDHIDGDSTNHAIENLRVLCPSCHSLTSNYRGLNRGKGRKRKR